MTRWTVVRLCVAGMLTACGQPGAATPAGRVAPRFEVDPLWPEPLPKHWVIGSRVGITVDSRDHVWIIHAIDPMDNVWIGGNGPDDAHILKSTRNGRFLLQLGKPKSHAGSHDAVNVGRVAKITFDGAANEAFVADGYLNKRVAVLDMSTGAMKRYWGAYGNPPDDTDLGAYDPEAPPAAQFRNPVHCAEPTADGLLYVCDRVNDRIQVFRKDGTYVSELRVAPRTRGGGSVWDIAFSRDPAQTYIFLADGGNERVWIIERKTMEILTSFGDGGRQPGQFFGVHSIATDSRGNLYTTETFEGKRVQNFVNRGSAPVEAAYLGVVWPE